LTTTIFSPKGTEGNMLTDYGDWRGNCNTLITSVTLR